MTAAPVIYKSVVDLLYVADVNIVQNIATMTKDLSEGSEKLQHGGYGLLS